MMTYTFGPSPNYMQQEHPALVHTLARWSTSHTDPMTVVASLRRRMGTSVGDVTLRLSARGQTVVQIYWADSQNHLLATLVWS